MRVILLTPPKAGRQSGNAVTAMRWASHLRALGHRVTVTSEGEGTRTADLLIALHVVKSRAAVAEVRHRQPDIPVVVMLTGTDVYGDLQRPQATQVLEDSWRLVALQERASTRVPRQFRGKIRVVHQSVPRWKQRLKPLSPAFEVTVLAHLRHVKDPLRAAYAVRNLPEASRIRVTHLGAVTAAFWRERATRESRKNPRYHWYGEVPRSRALQILGRSRILVVSSRLEGGANVVSEALAGGVPVLASRIPGNLGPLGADYPGYFGVGDTKALTRCMLRAESDPAWHRRLRESLRRRSWIVDPRRERDAIQNLLAEL